MTALFTRPDGQLRPRFVPPLPLPLVQFCLNRMSARAAERYDKIFARLGAYSQTTYLVDPTDLSFVISLQLDRTAPKIRAYRRFSAPPYQAKISGTLRHLMRLIEGELDGDALFFSRDLKVEGDTAAIVVLRNALDNMDGDFFADAANVCGPLRRPARFVLSHLRSQAL